MWHYPSVRQSSQSLLESLTSVYDLRLRALPALYKALQPGTDDDRMKGALWTLNISSFGRFSISEPTLVPEIIQQLFGCHHNEKPSIQNCVSAVTDTCLASFSEPCYLIYDIKNTALDEALLALKSCLSFNKSEDCITLRAREKRIERVRLMNEEYNRTTQAVLEIANDATTHWRYAIVAVRVLRTLLRRDTPTSPSHLRLFLEKVCDSNPTMRYVRS
jgi:proteasome activator subunit 4